MLKLKLQYLATWCKELTHYKRPWERLEAGEEGDNRGPDGWMASLTRWTWVWASSGSWWWTRKTGMLQFMGSQRVGHDWTELKGGLSNVYSLILVLVTLKIEIKGITPLKVITLHSCCLSKKILYWMPIFFFFFLIFLLYQFILLLGRRISSADWREDQEFRQAAEKSNTNTFSYYFIIFTLRSCLT